VKGQTPPAIFPQTEPDTHFELHFNKRVDFVNLEMRKTGSSRVHPVK
jgi:hypothetical protein